MAGYGSQYIHNTVIVLKGRILPSEIGLKTPHVLCARLNDGIIHILLFHSKM